VAGNNFYIEGMEEMAMVIRQMINISDQELSEFLNQVTSRKFKRQEIISRPSQIPQDIFFIVKGIIRVIITDNSGVEHTIHFALENQFIADYSSFMLKKSSLYSLQAIEETEVIVLPRSAIEWGYENLKEGQKLGRLIAEFYFIYQDDRIKNMYARTPKERYDNISDVFPNIHNRVPQHMIASYLGVTPVHLSRLKKS
jgi:signal-transduction protein with cAMP-binding, CBS, and nucleotidyltransferase domain